MPDANGKIAGHGWSRAHEDAWTRVFGDDANAQARHAFLHEDAGPAFVPPEPPDEVEQGRWYRDLER